MTTLSHQFEEALVYAVRLHSNQLRKGNNIPYASHLLGVAALVLEYGGDETQVIAALLHDAVEDQGGAAQLEEIRKRFGEGVAQIVADCTDSWDTPKPPWLGRKQAYLEHIPSLPPASLLVSLADKINNGRCILHDHYEIGDAVWDRFKGGKEGTLWYYRALVQCYKKMGSSPLVIELDKIVTELEQRAARI